MKPILRARPGKHRASPLAPLTEEAALEAMWQYYRDHKSQLNAQIRDHRASILTQLIAGASVQDAFAPHWKPAPGSGGGRSGP